MLEGDDAVPSQVEIRCGCAFTYMNAVFRKNLTEALAINANDEDTVLGTGGAFYGVTGIALSRRTIVTWTSGVSDPLRAGRGAKKGAAKWGSLTPHCRSARLRQRRRLRHRRHRAPPVVVPRTGRLARTVRISAIGAMTLVTVQRDGFSVGGTVLPSFGSHHLFLLGSIRRGQPGMVLRVREGLGAGGAICLPGSPNRPAGGR
jgi:hypothetical protein